MLHAPRVNLSPQGITAAQCSCRSPDALVIHGVLGVLQLLGDCC